MHPLSPLILCSVTYSSVSKLEVLEVEMLPSRDGADDDECI